MSLDNRYPIGSQIGKRYLVHQVLLGGMGEVYLCLDTDKNLPYALKTFQSRFLSDIRIREAFKEEIRTWVALGKHANIVRCHMMEVLDGQPFALLDWIPGEEGRGTDLRAWLRSGPIDIRLALQVALDICRGLIHAGQ